MNNYNEVKKDLLEKGFAVHHVAYSRGYFPRKVACKVETYCGRFGSGFKVHENARNSSRFHYVTYFIKTE